jgi:hypothetical protein
VRARPTPGLLVSRLSGAPVPGRLAQALRLAAMAMQVRAVRQWRAAGAVPQCPAARPSVHRVRAAHQFRVESPLALSIWEAAR